MSNLFKTLTVFADELERFDLFASSLLTECIPKNADKMLPDFETVFGITPVAGATAAQRRAVLNATILAIGGQSVAYFYSIAAALGYNIHPSTTDPHIQIVEGVFPAFRADVGKADIDKVYDQGTGSSVFTCQVKGTGVQSDTALQKLFNKITPAHIEIQYINI